MCRNIKPLFNFDPPVSDDEVRAAALQYVHKISGSNEPSKANEAAIQAAVDAVAAASSTLLLLPFVYFVDNFLKEIETCAR